MWDERLPATAKTQIHGLISRVRRVLPQPLIATRSSGYVLELPAEALDIQRFTTLTATARELIAEEQFEQGTQLMNDALGLWRGPALPGIPVPPCGHPDVAVFQAI
ncbi:BTAD domain-containing putative transcriptional regulator [Amycolatopsis sp. NPDC058278]|uniref:AfsR/SARP family transcriptional regulator n=1 Tax=Amycolatopsis sp. NPDC058278 TaxID=3346417 RepID=UPI0036DCCD2B